MASTTMSVETTPSYPVLDDARYIPVLIIGLISTSLSMIGSSCVLYMTAKDMKKKILHRMIFGMSLADLFSSASLFFSPFSIPSYIGLPAAVGTHATCTLTGFFFYMGVMSGCVYNAYLSLYYCMLVRRNWREQDFKKWAEILGHGIAILIPLAIAVFAAVTKTINPQPLLTNVCLFAPSPLGCEHEAEGSCQRSSIELVRTLSFPSVLVQFSFSVTGFVCTLLVYCTVQSTLRRASLHQFEGDINVAQQKRLKNVQLQAGLYSLAYLNTLVWPVAAVVLTEITGPEMETKKLDPGYYALYVLVWVCYPLQGFLNFFVYTRMKVQQWRKTNPSASLFWIYQQVLSSATAPTNASRITPTLPATSRDASFRTLNPFRRSTQPQPQAEPQQQS